MSNNLKIHFSLFHEFWEKIIRIGKGIPETNLSILAYLYGCESAFDLKPLFLTTKPGNPSGEIFFKKPSFKDLLFSDLDDLRSSLRLGKKQIEISVWAEYLLRFVELNLSTMKKKVNQKFPDNQTSRLFLLELCAFLLDIFYETHDLRFLNASLKMIDIPGLITIKSIRQDLGRQDNRQLISLYQIRVLMMSEAAILQLST